MLFLSSNDLPLISNCIYKSVKIYISDLLYCLDFYWHELTLSDKFCSHCSRHPLGACVRISETMLKEVG